MPEITREILWRQLKQGHIEPVYVLAGVETFLRDRAVSIITSHAFCEGDLREFNYDEYDLNDRDAFTAALAAAEQLPMMSSRRVIKVTGVRVASTSIRDTLKEEAELRLGEYLADPTPSTVLIIVADELNGNRKITRLLQKHASVVKFDRMSEGEVVAWVRKQVTEDGFRIDENALRRLVELAGADLRRLTNEIKKLSAASLPDKQITVELVEGLVPDANPLENFALTDAIVSGRGSRAMSVLKKILDDGAEPVVLLGLVSYNFRKLTIAKDMMDSGADRKDVAGVLRMRYNEQENFLAAARRADRDRLTGAFDLIHKADVAMKTSLGGGGDHGTRMQIEVLVCELASAMSR